MNRLAVVTLWVAASCSAQNATDSPADPVTPAASPASTPYRRSWNTVRKGETYAPLTNSERGQFLLRRAILSGGAPFRAAMLAAFDQRDNDPPGWGQGWDAYAQRVGNRLARTALRNGIESGAAAALGHEVRYIQCNCDGLWRRMGHALAMNFVTYDRDGHWAPHYSRVGSTITAEYIAITWLPDGTRTAREVTRGLGLQLAAGSLTNVWREFSPPLMRQVKRRLRR